MPGRDSFNSDVGSFGADGWFHHKRSGRKAASNLFDFLLELGLKLAVAKFQGFE